MCLKYALICSCYSHLPKLTGFVPVYSIEDGLSSDFTQGSFSLLKKDKLF